MSLDGGAFRPFLFIRDHLGVNWFGSLAWFVFWLVNPSLQFTSSIYFSREQQIRNSVPFFLSGLLLSNIPASLNLGRTTSTYANILSLLFAIQKVKKNSPQITQF